ncbi:MAG: hypothetical protein COU07_01910 [Candidatus Harrisonbacteria bacterium CG10_big_fil_rev_8_21_14_0_10_40_38]|uniref:DNA replication/recombination mediator RecO N-terminal domain-containing protein n=1 Tax=Candidatus Harrisonbacteria bacterium CG10_big_fil_rev_8_21_14_0_10_40_38 TaxID=1974583 RepID=A0A2H0UV25_9BACT|nr:MAG: hypothetical protein COU07_01910 [Candidatus Harrisonbacteria bacterium CG10_big_fil_rev_8_21_14_0_10_40_38]
MREHFTEAIVLNREPSFEQDLRVLLYTRALGKISAKITSGRRITSKLSPHLDILNIAKIRLAEGGGFQIADALKIGSLPLTPESFRTIHVIEESVIFSEPDFRLWSALRHGGNTLRKALAVLGFDPSLASCIRCGYARPRYFSVWASDYTCSWCFASLGSPHHAYVDLLV